MTMLEVDARRSVALWRKPDFHLAGMCQVRLVLPFRVELPCQHEAARWIPHEHPAPIALASVHRFLIAAAAGLRFDDGLFQRRRADGVAARPPCIELVGEDLEGAFGAGLH